MALIITIVVVLALALGLGIFNNIQEKKNSEKSEESMKNI